MVPIQAAGPRTVYDANGEGSSEVETSITTFRSERKEERGRVTLFEPQDFLLVFEKYPIWLLALNPSFTKRIYCNKCKTLLDLLSLCEDNKIEQSLYQATILILGNQRFRFSSPLCAVTTLVSGSMAFLNEKYLIFGKRKAIYITDEHKVFRRQVPHGLMSLSRIKHTSLGGATNYEGLYAYSGTTATPKFSSLRRQVGDFIDYGVPPTTVLPQQQFISHKSLMPVTGLSSLVQYPTHFSLNGIGYRALSPTELAKIFGVSTVVYQLTFHNTMFPIVPVQILDALLLAVLHSSDNLGPDLLQFTPPPISTSPGFTFLTSLSIRLSDSWSTVVGTKDDVATDDSAAINQSIWDQRIILVFPKASVSILNWFRRQILTKHFYRVFNSFKTYLIRTYPNYWEAFRSARKYLEATPPADFTGGGRSTKKRTRTLTNLDLGTEDGESFSKDLTAGRIALRQYMHSSYMKWDGGSSLLFWRWPESSRETARDGIPPYIYNSLPTNQPKTRPISAEHEDLVLSKILVCIQKGYIILTSDILIRNYIDYFAVAKGSTDIRVVYNGASCGLNLSLFASSFWLPTSKTLTRFLSFGYKSVDLDIGEMFPNFPLHTSLRSFSGVDLTQFKDRLGSVLPSELRSNNRLSGAWTRLWFGMKNSPELSVTYYYLAEEFIRGNHQDLTNPLRWDEIRLNLIGNKDYNPTFPKVYKWDKYARRIAGELIAYIDDLRSIGYSLEQAWLIARRVGSYLQYLGIQDAARKRRVDEGPWAGGMFSTSDNRVTKTVTKAKWLKAKTLIQGLVDDLKQEPEAMLSYKRLERIRGFLCHLAMVYDPIFPYLKGFHLTLAAHLPNRNSEGWKISELEWIGYIEDRVEKGVYTRQEGDELVMVEDTSPPHMVKPVPRFITCLKVLALFLKEDTPPIVNVRSTSCLVIVYGFMDASGSGFGSTLLVKGNIKYRIGTWSSSEDTNSSNWREFENLVCEVEQAGEKGWFKNCEVVLATDN